MTKGFNQSQLGHWYAKHLKHYVRPVAITNDGSRWDATMNRRLLKSEYQVYSTYPIRAKPKRALAKSLYKTTGVTKHGIKFSIDDTRKSGDPNTSVGNSIINGTASSFVYNYILSLSKCPDPTERLPITIMGGPRHQSQDENAP